MRGGIATGKAAVKEGVVRLLMGLAGGVLLGVLMHCILSRLFALGPDVGPHEPFLAVATVMGGALGFALGAVSPDLATAGRRLLPVATVKAVVLVLVSLA